MMPIPKPTTSDLQRDAERDYDKFSPVVFYAAEVVCAWIRVALAERKRAEAAERALAEATPLEVVKEAAQKFFGASAFDLGAFERELRQLAAAQRRKG